MERALPASDVDFEVLALDLGGTHSGILLVNGVTPRFDVGCPIHYRVLSGEGAWTSLCVWHKIAEGDEFDFPWGFPVRFAGRFSLMFSAQPATEINSTPFDAYPMGFYDLSEREIKATPKDWSEV